MSEKRSNALCCFLIATFVASWMVGCAHKQSQKLQPQCEPCQTMLQQIEYPDLVQEVGTDGAELLTGPPVTISNFQEMSPQDVTIEQAVEMALANSKIMNKLGGVVVSSPAAASTLYDQALIETNPNASVEAALSAFDAQFNTSLNYIHSERTFNNAFAGAGAASLNSNTAQFQAELSKLTATGATFSLRNRTDYNRNNSPANTFLSTWDTVNTLEMRQPLLRGRGTQVNRIAGPNAIAGQYGGVLIARIRSDVSLADFETSVRNLIRDVENNYWELYFAYRDLDTKVEARDAARETWENRKLRFENGVGRPDDEAQARQQYFSFQAQAQNALTGVLNGSLGVLGAERNLRRLLGLPTADGTVLRPVTEPTVAPVAFDWNDSQSQALGRRVEIRRQKWTLRQRELEFMAAKQLNQWSLDVVGNYGFRGFGDNLFGSRGETNGSAWESLRDGTLDDWTLGFQFGGPIGQRQGHLAVRNAELNLVREKAILKEQQRQILHDLAAAFTEVDRSLVNMQTNFNSRIAVHDEFDPKQKRVQEGKDQVFFLLDVQQRVATSESAVHRAIVDYNKALLNYAFTSGSLLSRYNIRLTEGPWNENAQREAREKACRLKNCGPNDNRVDNCPVSRGELDQTAPPVSASEGYSSVNYDPYGNSAIESYAPATDSYTPMPPADSFDNSDSTEDLDPMEPLDSNDRLFNKDLPSELEPPSTTPQPDDNLDSSGSGLHKRLLKTLGRG